jgi:hypothetical protein
LRKQISKANNLGSSEVKVNQYFFAHILFLIAIRNSMKASYEPISLGNGKKHNISSKHLIGKASVGTLITM